MCSEIVLICENVLN